MTEVVQRIEERRKDLDLSRREMCLRSGVAVTTYSNYVRRGDEIPIQKLEAIASTLGVTVGYLRFGAEVGSNLQAEMNRLTEKIARLKPRQQERIIVMMNDVVDSYNQE